MNTEAVEKVVKSNDVIALRADYTDGDEEISQLLTVFRSNTLPLTVVFPGDDPNRPLVLRDLITKSQVLRALEEAGPSRSAGSATAMR